MQYLGGKLTAAQIQVAGWVGSVRRSLRGALGLVWGSAEEEEDNKEREGEEGEVEGGGRFQRTVSPLRSFARRSRRSLRRFSIRNRQTLDKGTRETCSEQSNSNCTEVLDTEVLIDCQPGQQHGDCEEASSKTDSPKSIRALDQDTNISPDDLDNPPANVETDLPAFPECSNPLLDTSAQRMRVELGKRRNQRTRPPKLTHQSSALPPCSNNLDWRVCDSTDGKVIRDKRKGSDSEEEQPRVKEVCSPPPTSQRVPMFPGLSPSLLMAHLKKRASGGAEDEGVEKDRPNEETQPSASQHSRSPRDPALLAGAARVLPLLGGADGGPVSSPSWLKELKSKKRLSHYNTET